MHWGNFIIPTFIVENNGYSRHLCKIWKEFISFDIKKKRQSRIGFSSKNLSILPFSLITYMVFKFYNDKTYDYKTRIINESYKNLNLPIMVYLGDINTQKTLWRGRVKLELHTRQITLVKDIQYVFGLKNFLLSM